MRTVPIYGGADRETGALVLVGDAAAFGELARLLRRLRGSKLELRPLLGRPMISPVRGLRLGIGDRATTIRISGQTATLVGSLESRVLLAGEIELFLEHNDLDERGMHTHLDAPSGDAVEHALARDSRDLILAGLVPDEPVKGPPG